MDTRRQELLTILGHIMAGAIAAHERREGTGLDPAQRAWHLLPLLEYAADRIKVWARPRGTATTRGDS